jgi:hypothetical protein
VCYKNNVEGCGSILYTEEWIKFSIFGEPIKASPSFAKKEGKFFG